MSYVLTKSTGGLKAPVKITEGGTGAADGLTALNNLIVDGGGTPDRAAKSLTTVEWGDQLTPDPSDPPSAILQIVDFLTLLGVCNQ
tara:strand:+ start:6499 stop:6756 length:258 start_codon:yes stop_codon:yes gene_type:complete